MADDTKQVPLPLPNLLVDLALYRSLYHLLCMAGFNYRLVFSMTPPLSTLDYQALRPSFPGTIS
jgi:hypothetical protein